MGKFNLVTTEYIRRYIILILIALFAWMFFYIPSDIYNIQYQNYKNSYNTQKELGILNSNTSLQEYIERKMQGPYWHSSPKKIKLFKAKGDAEALLNKIISESGSKRKDYFVRKSELPDAFKFNTALKEADYIVIDRDGEKKYFTFYHANRDSMLSRAPLSIRYPLRGYSYLLIILAILIYVYLPREQIPKGAAYYTKFNAVYLADILGFSLWSAAWMLFFLPDDSAPLLVRYFLLLFFGIFALVVIVSTVKYASSWYLFSENSFLWSDKNGLGKVSLDDIVSIKPYKRQLPKWVAPLLILFGKGEPIATGAGLISMSSAPEIGVEILTKSGKKIKVMQNYLEADKMFIKRFKELENRTKEQK